MKIQNINPIYYQNYNSQRVTNSNQSQTVFRSAPCVQEAMKKFIPEAGFFVFNTPNITPQVLETFLKRFYPKIKVENVGTIPIHLKQSRAQTQVATGFDFSGRPYVQDMTMKVELDNVNSFEDRVDLLDSIVHEMTHVYQNDPTNSESTAWLTSKRLFENAYNIDALKKVATTGQDVIKVWHDVEQKMLYTPTEALRISQILPSPTPCLDSLLLESTYYRKHGKYGEEYLKSIIKENYKAHNIQDPILANQTIKEMAKNEAEAYRNGNQAVRDVLGIKGPVDRDFIPMVFDIISNATL